MTQQANPQGNGKGRELKLAVSEKGAIMVLGLRSFPVTFYRDEWQALAKLMPHIERYAQVHAAELKGRQPSTTPSKAKSAEVVTI